MKGITKERMLILIQNSYKDGQVIMENDSKLETLWSEYADTYYVENGKWEKFYESDKWKTKEEN